MIIYENKIKEAEKLKEEIERYRPISSNLLKQLREYYRIGLTYSSNAIEGNSLTETETKVVLEDGITIGGKPLIDHYEATGHSEAYNLLLEIVKDREIKEKDILDLHYLFYYRIDKENAGRYRKEKVIITGSSYLPPLPNKVSALMKRFIEEIPIMKEGHHPIECAALLHKEFVAIHPFVDGNGRVARLLMNLALLQEEYTITIIPPVKRVDYINFLEIAHTKKDTRPFINFISCMVYESLKEYLIIIRG
ncbi:MAG: Fic family protein [bacterium]|nr:Fic family protein [bacterium]